MQVSVVIRIRRNHDRVGGLTEVRFVTNGQHIFEEVDIRLPPKNKCDDIVTLPRIGVHSIENALVFVLSGILFRGPRLMIVVRRCGLDVKGG